MNDVQSWDLSRLEETKSGGNHASGRREIDIRRICDVLVVRMELILWLMKARNCVSCVGLDIRNFVLVFKVRLILTGMHKLAGNHADVAHVVNCLAVFMMFMT